MRIFIKLRLLIANMFCAIGKWIEPGPLSIEYIAANMKDETIDPVEKVEYVDLDKPYEAPAPENPGGEILIDPDCKPRGKSTWEDVDLGEGWSIKEDSTITRLKEGGVNATVVQRMDE